MKRWGWLIGLLLAGGCTTAPVAEPEGELDQLVRAARASTMDRTGWARTRTYRCTTIRSFSSTQSPCRRTPMAHPAQAPWVTTSGPAPTAPSGPAAPAAASAGRAEGRRITFRGVNPGPRRPCVVAASAEGTNVDSAEKPRVFRNQPGPTPHRIFFVVNLVASFVGFIEVLRQSSRQRWRQRFQE